MAGEDVGGPGVVGGLEHRLAGAGPDPVVRLRRSRSRSGRRGAAPAWRRLRRGRRTGAGGRGGRRRPRPRAAAGRRRPRPRRAGRGRRAAGPTAPASLARVTRSASWRVPAMPASSTRTTSPAREPEPRIDGHVSEAACPSRVLVGAVVRGGTCAGSRRGARARRRGPARPVRWSERHDPAAVGGPHVRRRRAWRWSSRPPPARSRGTAGRGGWRSSRPAAVARRRGRRRARTRGPRARPPRPAAATAAPRVTAASTRDSSAARMRLVVYRSAPCGTNTDCPSLARRSCVGFDDEVGFADPDRQPGAGGPGHHRLGGRLPLLRVANR